MITHYDFQVVIDSENESLSSYFIQCYLHAYKRYEKQTRFNVIGMGAMEHDELFGYYDIHKKLMGLK